MKHSHIDPKSDPAVAGEGDENFLSRWSRRKSGARQEESESRSELVQEGVEPVDPEAERQREIEERNQLADEDMPALETLDENSDYSPFLSENVSEDLRRLALRQMFRLPKFGMLDGLNDYDEDYTVFEPLGDTITSDMRFHAERQEEERKRREAEQLAVASENVADESENTARAETVEAEEEEDTTALEKDNEGARQLTLEDELDDIEVIDG